MLCFCPTSFFLACYLLYQLINYFTVGHFNNIIHLPRSASFSAVCGVEVRICILCKKINKISDLVCVLQ